jgi:hypothetical protein
MSVNSRLISRERALERQAQVGVLHHDLGVFASHLERDALQALAARGGDLAPDGGRACERDELDIGMADESGPGLLAEAVDQVGDAGRDTGLFENLEQAHGAERRVFRGLEHDGVAAEQRGEELPRRDRHREVPRRDQRADPHRNAHGHGELVRQLGRRGDAEQAPSFAAGVKSGVDPLLDVPPRLFQDLSHLARHVAGDLFFSLPEQRPRAEEDLSPLRRGQEAPAAKRLLRRGDRFGDVVGGGSRKDADQIVTVGGVSILERLSRSRLDPLSADVVFVKLGHGRASGRGLQAF